MIIFRNDGPDANPASWGCITPGDDIFAGSGSAIHAVTICSGVVTGAGSVVIRNITEKGVCAGNPAEVLR